MQTYMHHLADQQAANHKGRIQLNDNFYHYTLHRHSQDPNPYRWPTLEQFRATIAWPRDMPIFPEKASPTDDQGGGRTNEDEDMIDPIDDYIGGN